MSAPLARHTIVCHARPEFFAPGAWVLLCRLGYAMWLTEDYERRSEDDREDDRPALRIVDERRLGEVEDEPGWAPTPIVLLTGGRGASGADTRVVGAVGRPATVHALYRVMQQVLEAYPRAVPRVSTHLRASCARRDRRWEATILSLSENGCLLRSPEPVPLDARLTLSFGLPGLPGQPGLPGPAERAAPVEIEADASYQLLPDVGLVFSGLAPSARLAIQRFVMAVL